MKTTRTQLESMVSLLERQAKERKALILKIRQDQLSQKAPKSNKSTRLGW